MVTRFDDELLLLNLGDQVGVALAAERQGESWIELQSKHECLQQKKYRGRRRGFQCLCVMKGQIRYKHAKPAPLASNRAKDGSMVVGGRVTRTVRSRRRARSSKTLHW